VRRCLGTQDLRPADRALWDSRRERRRFARNVAVDAALQGDWPGVKVNVGGVEVQLDVVAIYAAVVSTVLGIVRLIDFRTSRERLHFSVYVAELWTKDPAWREKPRPEFVAIAIGNRAPMPLHITSVGFMLRRGTGLYSNPIPGLTPALPKRLEPSEGLTWYMLPAALQGGVSVDQLQAVYAFDGASRRYVRPISRQEREQLRKVIGPELTSWQQRLAAWWRRRWWTRPEPRRA
jgi:hypothetical protein